MGTTGVARAYATGQGSIVIRAKTHFEKVRSGRNAIVATELPYQVIKSELLAKTADAINARRIEGIADLRDDERRAAARLHIVEGLCLATANVDAVVALIRASDAPADAKAKLVEGGAIPAMGALSEDQASAVLALTLSRLTTLEADKLDSERKDLEVKLEGLRKLMSEDAAVYDAVVDEVAAIKKAYPTPRRSEIVFDGDAELRDEDVIENARSAVLVARDGYVKRTSLEEFGAQSRGGRGRNALQGGTLRHLVTCHDHDTLLCIADTGVAYGVRAFNVPQASRAARGVPVPSVLPVDRSTRIKGLLAVAHDTLQNPKPGDDDELFLVVLTRNGLVKKTPLAAFKGLTSRGLIAIKLGEGDAVTHARLCRASDSLILATAAGMVTRSGGMGVSAIKFKKKGDDLVSICPVAPNDEVMVVTESGVIVRMDAPVTAQSRTATGVLVQKAAKDDALVDLTVVDGHAAAVRVAPRGSYSP
ncbi:DNA topoisomerase type II [Aureococcus anophagefferens]|nr:DNA topoisomerase type II [Aureococcus anophagefferens]